MLAAAHVLAMDAKNLLDVVDAIRSRYPIENQQHLEKLEAQKKLATPTGTVEIKSEQLNRVSLDQTSPTNNGNGPELNAHPENNSVIQPDEIYANQTVMHQSSGIYDNESIINLQQQQLAANDKKKKVPPAVAAKPSKLVQRFRENLMGNEPNTNFVEPLKIVEENIDNTSPNELYSNVSIVKKTQVSPKKPLSPTVASSSLVKDSIFMQKFKHNQ